MSSKQVPFEIDSSTDDNSSSNAKGGSGKRYCVYVLLCLKKKDFNGFTIPLIWKTLQFEEVLNRSLYQKRVYVGCHELNEGEEVRARGGHRKREASAIVAMPDADEWDTFDWVAVECNSKAEMLKMESFLIFFCRKWSELDPQVECLNRYGGVAISSEDIRLAFSMANEGHKLAVYTQRASRQSLMELEFIVPEEKFKQYRR